MARKKNLPKITVAAKKRFTNLIIIDASGSMSSKAVEVIGGIKALFKDIRDDAAKNPNVETTTIVVDFSSARDYRELVNTKDVAGLLDSLAEAYSTRGMTALYDAIGFAFAKVPADQDGVFVNILTDGEENDSKELKGADVKKLIEDGKSKGWAITFMGTDESCINTAVSLGISRGNTMQFTNTAAGAARGLEVTKLSRTAYYTSTVNLSDTPGKALDLENIVSNVVNES
jgi:uncharacterized protein YegL